jgi:hypothetical protein
MTYLSQAILATAFVASLSSVSLAQVRADENCQEKFAGADVNGDGSLGNTEGRPFYERRWGQQSDSNDIPIISRSEFLKDCSRGRYNGL